MLTLTRRIGKTLIIGDDTQVVVFGVKSNQVRLSIQAPANVSVDREEVRQRKDSESLQPR